MDVLIVQDVVSRCCDAVVVRDVHGFHCTECGFPVYQSHPDY